MKLEKHKLLEKTAIRTMRACRFSGDIAIPMPGEKEKQPARVSDEAHQP